MQWQEEHARLTAENLAKISSGEFANGRALFFAQRAENFGVPLNAAVRQFDRFCKEKCSARREMAELLGIEPKNSLAEYSEDERIKIAKFIRVAKVIVPYFLVPTLLNGFCFLGDRLRGMARSISGENTDNAELNK